MMQESGAFTIHDLLFCGNQDPDQPAIESPEDQPLTYGDLRNQVLSVIRTLNARGYRRNDRIAVITPAGPETAVITLAVMTGFTCIPLNPQATAAEYEDWFEDLRVQAVIVQKGCGNDAATVAGSRAIPVIELTPVPGRAGKFTLEPAGNGEESGAVFATQTDISYVFLTSGTTARPKKVPVTQRAACIIQQINCRVFGLSRADRCLHLVPFYHGLGIGPPLLSVLLAGGTVICPRDFIPPDFPGVLRTCRPSFYPAVPALHQAILRQLERTPPEELRDHSLRFIRSGSASLPSPVRCGLERLLKVPVIDVFAMSEAGIICINCPPRPGSAGKAVIERVLAVDEHGEALGPFGEGEIVISGDVVFGGYEDAPEENEAAFSGLGFRTGDTGYLDGDGYLFLTGRKKEIINKGGRKVSPAEIDDVLRSHPGIRDAMTFPVPDPVLGEDVAALVVAGSEPVTETNLRRFLLDRLAPFKVPRRIFFVDQVPRNATGKLLRSEGSRWYGQPR